MREVSGLSGCSCSCIVHSAYRITISSYHSVEQHLTFGTTECDTELAGGWGAS